MLLILGFVGTASAAATPKLKAETTVCENPTDGCCACANSTALPVGGGGICPLGTSLIASESADGNEWCIQCRSIQPFIALSTPLTPDPTLDCVTINFPCDPAVCNVPQVENLCGTAFAGDGSNIIPIEVQVVCAKICPHTNGGGGGGGNCS